MLKVRCKPLCFDIPVAEKSAVIARVLPRYLERLRILNLDIEERRVRELFHIYFPDLRALANQIEMETMASLPLAS